MPQDAVNLTETPVEHLFMQATLKGSLCMLKLANKKEYSL